MENTNVTKLCSGCKEIKDSSSFYIRKDRKNGHGLKSLCKLCCKNKSAKKYIQTREYQLEKNRIYRQNNKEHIKKYNDSYRNNPINKEKHKILDKNWREKNKQYNSERGKKYREENKDRLRILQRNWMKKQRKINIKYNISQKISKGIRKSLKNGKNGYHWEDIVGYTFDELRNHLKKQFTGKMSWKYILNSEIEIEHILPIELFEYTSFDSQLFQICWSLDNLRPMWKQDNRDKSDFLPDGRRASNLTSEEKLEYLRSLGYKV